MSATSGYAFAGQSCISVQRAIVHASVRDEFAGKLYPPTGSSAQLLLQRLGSDDPATAVRAHIDLGADDIAAEAERLVGLGAKRLGPGRGWIVLRDPVGMVFCVTGNSPNDP